MRRPEASFLYVLRNRRYVLGFLAALLYSAAMAPLRAFAMPSQNTLEADLAEMLMLGFYGNSTLSPFAHVLAHHIAKGRVGGVFMVESNIGRRDDVAGLIKFFNSHAPSKLFMAIDHEGGVVQRLLPRHGFTELPRPHALAKTLSPEKAEELFVKAGKELAALGFNFNLAPVVDMHDPKNPPIGELGRAFSSDPGVVAAYARAVVNAMRSVGVLSVLKHFPGQGHALSDSHDELPDITATWTVRELAPFKSLIASNHADAVMGGHAKSTRLEPSGLPTTLSKAVTTDLLRNQLGYQGVIITDDLDMTAIRETMSRKEAVIHAIKAGNDILMIKNVHDFDVNLPGSILGWVKEAIADGTLDAKSIAASAARVRRLKAKIAG